MLDQIDRRLVALLQKDGRLTNAELSAAVNLSPSACHRRVRRLEEAGVITGYTARVDPKKVGLSILGYVFVKLESHDAALLKAFARGLEAIDGVIACHAVSGGGDYLLKVAAADMDAFSDIALNQLVRLPGVKDSSTSFVLSTIKKETAWPV